MIDITSSKLKTLETEHYYLLSEQTASYAATSSWDNAGGGLAITVTKAGTYRISSQFTVNIGSTSDGRLALGIDDTNIDYTETRTFRNTITGTHYLPVYIESGPTYLTTGQVVTVRAKEVLGDFAIQYFAGADPYKGYLSIEMCEESIPIRDTAKNYSTTEIDTGKRWIDDKRIYRQVWTGTTGAGSSSSVSSGVSIDSIIQLNYEILDSSNLGYGDAANPTSGGTTYISCFYDHTNDEFEITHNAANVQSRPYTIILEYTK